MPTRIATLISFQSTLNTSFSFISSVASPRIISVELCEPQFPPVPIIIGINATNIGTAANAFSYCVNILPVNAADNININNHKILLLACLSTDI